MKVMHMVCRSAVIAGALSISVVLPAQGVVVQSTVDTHFYGALGTVVGLAASFGGGAPHESGSTMSVSGHNMRSDSPNTATIVDADAGRITQIDKKQKTYSSFTFAEMAAAMQRASQSMSRGSPGAPPAATSASKPSEPGKGDVDVKYTVSVDRPGQHEKVAGYDAERVFITITMAADVTPEGEKTQQAGSIILLLDQWISKDAPQIAALREFQQAYAQKAGATFRPQIEGLQAAFSADPRIKGGFEAAGKELAKVPGVSLRSTTYVVAVPPNVPFDRQRALNDAGAAAKSDTAKKGDAPKPGGFKGLMGAIKSAADDANRKQVAGNNNAPAPPPSQATMMSVKDEVTSINTAAVPPATFSVPSGYREVKSGISSQK